jgi:hypothetical protein
MIKHRIDDRDEITEVLTGPLAGQYVWAYPIGHLIEEVERAVETELRKAA